MKKAMMILALVGLAASPSFAALGDWWILPIDRLDNQGSFTTLVGAGYNGANAVQGSGPDGIRRVWWNTLNSIDSSAGATLPTGPELFTVEAWGPTTGAGDWQPIQAQYNGYAGDLFPIEPNIPWAGQFNTNAQWLGSEIPNRNAWNSTGPGPQTPNGGSEVYMTGGSVLYAKWDFPWSITRAWSAIRITQTTPEPASALLLLLALPLVRRKRSA